MKDKNLQIEIYIGIPASGKSTAAKEFVMRNPDWVRVNRDDFRLMLKNAQSCEPKIEDMITGLVNQTITNALNKKLNIIIDNTNLKAKYINAIIEQFKYSADINFRVFDISLEKAIERDSKREKKVGEVVIKKMFKDYKNLIDSFALQPVKKVGERPHLIPNFSSTLEHAVIFDIDGTLALMGRRSPYDWDKVHHDSINEIVAEQMDFHRSKGRKIILVSGRDEISRKDTTEWFDLHGYQFDELHMRPLNDFRRDTVVKREIYNNNIQPRYNVLAVYDDRISVVKEWNDMGLFVFTVNQGLHEF